MQGIKKFFSIISTFTMGSAATQQMVARRVGVMVRWVHPSRSLGQW